MASYSHTHRRTPCKNETPSSAIFILSTHQTKRSGHALVKLKTKGWNICRRYKTTFQPRAEVHAEKKKNGLFFFCICRSILLACARAHETRKKKQTKKRLQNHFTNFQSGVCASYFVIHIFCLCTMTFFFVARKALAKIGVKMACERITRKLWIYECWLLQKNMHWIRATIFYTKWNWVRSSNKPEVI